MRYQDALMIQDGACNVRGIARALVKAADEAAENNSLPSKDVAVRLIVHQLSHLCATWQLDDQTNYHDAMETCRQAEGPS